MFTSQQGDQWICQNAVCGAEFVVNTPSRVKSGGNPRCCCGSEMTRRYTAPTVRKLHREEAEVFLQDPEMSDEIRTSQHKQSKP
jgi:hypothetical protein